MAFLKNTVSLLAVFCVIPGAFGATSRVGVVTTNAARMPTLSAYLTNVAATTTTTTASSLLANAECIDAYTSCLKSEDVCGLDMEECTTNVLFHGKMPLCFSTLYQCQSAGISSLFGTSSIDALSNVSTKNAAGEVTRYTYPTDGSVLGQMIIGAKISNSFKDTGTCVKKYKSCLNKDTVCGEDFELCTDANSFKKQAVYCDGTLARCDAASVAQLFGKNQTTRPVGSYGTGTVAQWVADGADLAAANAVNTCYKVIDNCFLSACNANPYRCVEGTDLSIISNADLIGAGADNDLSTSSNSIEYVYGDNGVMVGTKSTAANIKKYFKTACMDTIGANKYCYMTFMEKTPSQKALADVDEQEEVFSEAYSNRKTYINSKLNDMVTKFDKKAKDACKDTITNCAMRTCGGGIGAACYTQVLGSSGTKSINLNNATYKPYDAISTGCSAVVNNDPYCKYAFASVTDGGYSYNYTENGAFAYLFPNDETSDPIGAVAELNSLLATSYNDAAIAAKKKQCQSVATSCVKSLCGTDYVNCYRNRTDIYSTLTNSGETIYDMSMNKVGGVLDYTIVLGLCLDTVKNSSSCTEHLAIATQDFATQDAKNSWNTGSNVGGNWLSSGNASAISVNENDNNVVIGCTSLSSDACIAKGVEACDTVDDEGCLFDQPQTISRTTYNESKGAESLFAELLYDIEKEAQAKYNAKLTKQQNMCMSGNTGGIMGASDTGSTYMWVKLKSNKVPSAYATQGLKTNQFVASNDLYGSFCRIKVTLQSDDKYIQDAISKGNGWSTAYFAAGDAFTCGSWIKQTDLEKITDDVRENAISEGTKTSQNWTAGMLTALGTLAGGAGGFAIANKLQQDGGISGLLGNTKLSNTGDKVGAAKLCQTETYDINSKCAGRNCEDLKSNLMLHAQQAGVAFNRANLYSLKGEEVAEEVENINKQCTAVINSNSNTNQTVSGKKNWIGAGIGGAVAGGLTFTTIKAIQETKNAQAEDAAVAEWMENIGEKIKCYIGSEEIGSYGDIISTELQ
ncbi:MAG: hypothetical protein KBS86_01730 [Proteobacteria bacterium]|nr:hypothetical protein [Candidatus Enterousia scatequi]